MFCRTVTLVSYPWSARHKADVWLKRHGKRPWGILFPLQPVLSDGASRAPDHGLLGAVEVSLSYGRAAVQSASGGVLCRRALRR